MFVFGLSAAVICCCESLDNLLFSILGKPDISYLVFCGGFTVAEVLNCVKIYITEPILLTSGSASQYIVHCGI